MVTTWRNSWVGILGVMEKSLSGGVFCLVRLFCFTEEIQIVQASADRETSDAADQHCWPHTDAQSDVCGGDLCHGTQKGLQICPGVLWRWKVPGWNFFHKKKKALKPFKVSQTVNNELCMCLSSVWHRVPGRQNKLQFSSLTHEHHLVIFKCCMVCLGTFVTRKCAMA